jgi:hypothetical protein
MLWGVPFAAAAGIVVQACEDAPEARGQGGGRNSALAPGARGA